MEHDHDSRPSDERLPGIRNIDLRRAVMAVLLGTDGPVTLDEIMTWLMERDRVDPCGYRAGSGRQRVSDMLRWQIVQGRVVRVAPGVYRAVPASMSRTTRWRCANWQMLRERRIANRAGSIDPDGPDGPDHPDGDGVAGTVAAR